MDFRKTRQQSKQVEEEDAGPSTRSRSKPRDKSTKAADKVFPPGNALLIDAQGLENTLKGLTNMALAHEICINKSFKLKKPDPSNEPVSPEVQEALDLKEKYWAEIDEIVRTKSIKECKSTIMALVCHLKRMLHGTTLPHNTKMKSQIDEELDLQRIATQIDNDAFDFQHYMEFILGRLAALCCPARDEEVVAVRNINVPSEQVRATIELMENMNLDMANFIIDHCRNQIMDNCISYERTKFASYIDLQYRLGKDPLRVTRNWILRNAAGGKPFEETMARAFVETLEWTSDEWPETLSLDSGRFTPLSHEMKRICLLGPIFTSVLDYTRTLGPLELGTNFEENEALIKRNVTLLNKLRENIPLMITPEEAADPLQVGEAMERCCLQMVKVVAQHRIDDYKMELTEPQRIEIISRVKAHTDPNNPHRVLYRRRFKEWIVENGLRESGYLLDLPQHLNPLHPIITRAIVEYMRLVAYIRNVFDVLFIEIHAGKCPPPKIYPEPVGLSESSSESDDEEYGMDESMLHALATLQGLSDKSKLDQGPLVRPVTPNGYSGVPLDVLRKSIQGMSDSEHSRKHSKK